MRTENAIRNIIFAFGGQFIGLLISFVSRLVFVKILSTEYLGISSLFTNILNILSFTELGIGTAIAVSLYKPIEEKNQEKIKTLMQFFKKIYISIGCLIIILGMAFLPFYKLTMNEVPNINNLNIIYMLFVINNAISYFFSYKRTLVITDQKRYIATFFRYLFYFLLNVVQIIALIITKNYILFLVIQIVFTFLENYFLSKYVDTIYPFLKDKNIEKIEKADIKNILGTFKYIIYHKFGGLILKTTDNICISKLLGVIEVGLYSNYYLITNALETVIAQVFNSIVASIGNLSVNTSREKMEDVFNKIFFANFWIYGFCSICLFNLCNPFIKLWLGEKYVLSELFVFVMVINFYIYGMRKTCMAFREATGNYKSDRYSPLIEAVINITSSIIFTKMIGLPGVFLGTILSCLCTCFWWEPLVIYRKSLKSNLFQYFKQYFKYTIITILAFFITTSINLLFNTTITIYSFIIKVLVSGLLPNIIFLCLNYNTYEFKFYIDLLNKKLRKK